MRTLFLSLVAPLLLSSLASGQSQPTTGVGHFPHLDVDVKNRQLRVECEALAVDAPLEFFCVLNGTSEHESVLRSAVRPSHVHAGLLMLGLKPGAPVKYDERAKTWQPPSGDALRLEVEFQGDDGKTVRVPAPRLMRELKAKAPMPDGTTWVFAGSRVMEDGKYAADVTGYLVSIVNFDLSLIDVPELKSNANETLEWERNPDVAPKKGTKVTLIVSPVGKAARAGEPRDAELAASRPIDAPFITVSRSGRIELDRRETAAEKLGAALMKLKESRPASARLAVESGTDAAALLPVLEQAKAAGVSVTFVDWPHGARP